MLLNGTDCRQGQCAYPDGSCYEGEYHQDQRQGWGSYITSDEQRYEGEWHHDTMHGRSFSTLKPCTCIFVVCNSFSPGCAGDSVGEHAGT